MIRPSFDRIVVEPDSPTKRSKGGIFYPDGASPHKSTNLGTVVDIGPGRINPNDPTSHIPVHVTCGDRIIYQAYNSVNFETDEEKPRKMVILNENDVLGIII